MEKKEAIDNVADIMHQMLLDEKKYKLNKVTDRIMNEKDTQ